MGFLILDTDRQSTLSLRAQLAAVGDLPVREVPDAPAYAKLRARRLPPPDVVFLDQDGDPEKVESFRLDLEVANPSSSVVYLGSERSGRRERAQDFYLRKPVFGRRLESALLQSYARGQQQRFGVGYLGGNLPSPLVRELPRLSSFWKQLLPVHAESVDTTLLARLGVLFILPSAGARKREEIELVQRIQRFTSASRILLVGIGISPGQTYELRNLADYFVAENADWKSVLQGLACRRLQRLESGLALQKIRALAAKGKKRACARELRRVLKGDPWNLTALGKAADLAFASGKVIQARQEYSRILELNPCQPRAYLRLLEIERVISGKYPEELLARARSYCPKVPAIRNLAEPGR